MKITYEWLKEYVDTGLAPQELAERLTMLGFESSVEGKAGGQHVFEVEVTPNRADCLCILGLAREISALTDVRLVSPEVKVVEKGGNAGDMVSVEIKTELCSRYCARVINGIKVGSSPDWLKKKLEAVGFRPINNVVDITNYVLMELGHPLHAFDYDRIEGKKIIVRCAGKGERLVTIDEIERKLEPWMIVIADEKKPVALAGMMGGLQTEVTDRTVTVLLESAYFDPSTIRRSVKRLQMETEASYRFQRKADIEGTVPAIERAAQLIQEIAGGEVAKGIVDCYPRKYEEREVPLRLSRLNRVLGVEFPADYVGKQLEKLGFAKKEEAGKFVVTVPSFRRDVDREIDLIEEIARLYGYDKIPVTIPTGKIPPRVEDKRAVVTDIIRGTLVASGLTEVINHGLISDGWAGLFAPEEVVVRLRNPLSEEQTVMCPSLLPGLLKTISLNMNRGVESARIFEVGNVFRAKAGDSPGERMSVAGAMTGTQIGDWERRKEGVGFYDIKGVLENLLQSLGITGWNLSSYKGSGFVVSESAAVKNGDCELGVIGKLDDSAVGSFDIEKPVYVFELDFEFLLDFVSDEKRFEALPKYPASFRDIAIVVPEKVMSGDIVSAITAEGEGIVEKVELFDLYRGDQVPDGHKSLAYAITYRADDRTLTDDEINKLHGNISQKLVSGFKGRIR